MFGWVMLLAVKYSYSNVDRMSDYIKMNMPKTKWLQCESNTVEQQLFCFEPQI